jgi:hypothetical protein
MACVQDTQERIVRLKWRGPTDENHTWYKVGRVGPTFVEALIEKCDSTGLYEWGIYCYLDESEVCSIRSRANSCHTAMGLAPNLDDAMTAVESILEIM